MSKLLDKFMELEKMDASDGLEVLKRSMRQTESLQQYYESASTTGSLSHLSFPRLEPMPSDVIASLEEEVRAMKRGGPQSDQANARRSSGKGKEQQQAHGQPKQTEQLGPFEKPDTEQNLGKGEVKEQPSPFDDTAPSAEKQPADEPFIDTSEQSQQQQVDNRSEILKMFDGGTEQHHQQQAGHHWPSAEAPSHSQQQRQVRLPSLTRFPSTFAEILIVSSFLSRYKPRRSRVVTTRSASRAKQGGATH